MSNRSNRKKLWISVAVAVVCAAIVVLSLILLFADDDVDNHIVIDKPIKPVQGELDLKLVRERLQTVTIDADGLPALNVSDRFTDFSNSKENIFGITENMLIGPKCYFAANMAISNSKPYSFEYWLEIVPQDGGNLLVDQLELTVTIEGETFVKRTLQSGLTTKIFPVVNVGETARFSVRLEYLDVQDNDLTKNTTLAFDMIVHARLIQS